MTPPAAEPKRCSRHRRLRARRSSRAPATVEPRAAGRVQPALARSSTIGYSRLSSCARVVIAIAACWCCAGAVCRRPPRTSGRKRRAARASTSPRSERPRRPGVLPRAQERSGAARRATSARWRPRRSTRRRVTSRWRSGSTPTTRSCSRRSSITIRFRSAPRDIRRAASGRFPGRSSDAAPRRGPDADARSDRADDPAGVPRPAGVSGARPRRDRRRPAAQRGLHGGGDSSAQLNEAAPSASPARSASRSTARNNQMQHQLDLLVARTGVRRRLCRQRRRQLFATRSPIERAVLAFVQPQLLTTEREFLEKNAVQGRVQALRLDAQRPHGTRRTMTLQDAM